MMDSFHQLYPYNSFDRRNVVPAKGKEEKMREDELREVEEDAKNCSGEMKSVFMRQILNFS